MVTFKRYAGSLQAEIRDFADLLGAIEIPKTQWVATACPIQGLNCDARFLHFVDTDDNGRIRVEEFVNAAKWTDEMLEDHQGVDKASDVLTLAHLAKEAKHIREAADLVLEAMGDESRKEIALEKVRASDAPLRAAFFNGDGIIAAESVKEARLNEVLKLAIAMVPETKNRSDKPGVTKEQLDELKKRIAKVREHVAKKGAAFVWGNATEARVDAIKAVRARLDEYFLQCRLAATITSGAEHLRVADDVVAASVGDSAALAKALAAAPLAAPREDGTLEWARVYRGPLYEALETLRTAVCEPVFGARPQLSEAQWKQLTASADAVTAWLDGIAADKVVFEKLTDLEKVTESEFASIVALADADLARKDKLLAIEQLEKLILFQRWLLRFANNFISMPDLYDPGYTALFEQGRMILSGRLFTFSVRVADRAAHSALAARGTMYIAYVKVTAKDGGETFDVAVPVTAGTAAGVEVGKRGVFIDHAGKEWDAAVVQIVTNPVSLFEAIVAPYKRIGAFVSSKVEAWAGEGDRELEQQMNRGYEGAQETRRSATTAATDAAAGDGPQARAAGAAAPSAPAGNTAGAGMGGNVAIALSIAISAVSAVIGTVVGIFAGKSIFQIIGMLFGLFMAVSFPAGVFAWLKLRKRDMAIVLEACGWALNDRMRLGKYLGSLFTRRPARPQGSRIETLDSVQETIERRRAEGLDEIERTGLRPVHWLVIVAVLLMAAAWQWRHALCVYGAGKHWMRATTCETDFFRIPPRPAATPAGTVPASAAGTPSAAH